VEKVQKALEDVVGEIQKTGKEITGPKSVAVVLEPPSILAHLPTLLQALANAGIVTALVIFMLLERRELRDRVILLIGYRRMTATTRAVFDQLTLRRLGAYRGLYLVKVSSCARARSRRPSRGRRWSAPGPSA
jgi:predicted PurR-regulated permease PerM